MKLRAVFFVLLFSVTMAFSQRRVGIDTVSAVVMQLAIDRQMYKDSVQLMKTVLKLHIAKEQELGRLQRIIYTIFGAAIAYGALKPK